MTTASFTLPSFAKINWTLRVLGRRPDGYHEIQTVLQTVSLHDQLHFSPSNSNAISLSCDEPNLRSDDTNLIVRAAHLLRENCKLDSGANIRLRKKIPVQGGLGGGSSNAAVTLLGLSYLWGLELTSSELIELGAKLGADVPFFLVGGTVAATGIGNELIFAEDCNKAFLIIITPSVSISTREAYAALKSTALTRADTPPILASSLGMPFLSESDQWPLHNDFENVIFEKEPEIKRVQETLIAVRARGVLLAGSGSSVFGIFDSAEAQRRALDEIQGRATWRIFPCNTVSRHEYLQAMVVSGTPLLRSSI